MVNNKNVFWQALLATILVFGIGLVLGFLLEGVRNDTVQNNLIKSEISLADEQLRNSILSNGDFNVSCKLSRESIFSFADKIYAEAVLMENYASTAQIRNILSSIHGRYDLLRVLLWNEALKNKKDCRGNFHTIVYFYYYQSENLDVEAMQSSFSHALADLKDKYSSSLLLIPIAGNTNLSSVDIVMKNYNITSLPAILLDEKKVFYDLDALKDVDKFISNSSFSSQ